LKNGVSDHHHDFCEDFNETSDIIKENIVDILSNYQLDLAHLRAYLSSADVNLGIVYSTYELLAKETERILLEPCPAHPD
jgi:hypothetical protein